MVTFEIKDGMIFDNECDSWVEIQEFLQMIINQSAETLKSSATLKFVSASDSDGNRWQYPTIKVANKYEANTVQQNLFDLGIPCNIDLYEDDDGYYPYRQIWSVTIPDMILKDLDLPHHIDDTVYKWDSESMSYVTC